MRGMIEMLWWHVPILGYHRVGVPNGDHVPTVSAEAAKLPLVFRTLRGKPKKF